MRVKVLGREDAKQVLLVYPTTLEEYREALEMLGRAARPGAGHGPARGARGPEHGRYVVTTEEQRYRWGLPNLSAGAGMRRGGAARGARPDAGRGVPRPL